jgi:hypothetical protein
MLIQIYVSSHGYGHTTRVAQICKALLKAEQDLLINIVTRRPARHLFFPSQRLMFVDLDVDVGIVQSNGYTVDSEASWSELQSFIKLTRSLEWQARHTKQLESAEPDLIICDAVCPFPWKSYTTVPRVLLSNFSFDGIFEGLLSDHDLPERVKLVALLNATYASGIDAVFRLPGFIDLPFLHNSRAFCIDLPLVYRPPSGRLQTDILSELGIPTSLHDSKVLLVQFGGHISGQMDQHPALPDGWICLCNAISPGERFFSFPGDFYTPDLVQVASMVLGKLGYGTVAECAGIGRPLLMVKRAMFAEEEGLQRYMADHGHLAEISASDFEDGRWLSHIQELHDKALAQPKGPVSEGSAYVACRLLQLVHRS